MSVAYEHEDYKKLSPKWKRVRDVCAGQDAVHGAGEYYLPKLKDQTPEDYSAMVKRTGFYNASWRTIAGFIGMLFRKEPTITVPTAIEGYLENVTMTGVDIDKFGQQAALEVLKVERVGILVDHPPAPSGVSLSVADAEKLGLRPTMQIYPTEAIINWKHKTVRNKTVLSMVVLKEEHREKKDEFEDKCETRYRVLDLTDANQYRQRVFVVKDGKDEQIGVDVFPLMNGQPLEEIPFFCDFDYEEPPMIDLIDLNLQHYRVSCDYEHACHFTALPTPWITGYQNPTPERPVTFSIGSTSAWTFSDPTAKVGFLEYTGQGIDAIKANLDGKELQMTILGARMLAPEKKAAETATTTAIHRTGENSVLSNVAIQVSTMLTQALKVFAKWAKAGGDNSIEYNLNRDFLPIGLDAPTITAYIALCQGGYISPESLHELLQRGDIVNDSFEDEQAKIDANPPPMPPATAVPPTGTPRPALKPPAKPGA